LYPYPCFFFSNEILLVLSIYKLVNIFIISSLSIIPYFSACKAMAFMTPFKISNVLETSQNLPSYA
jgi:hypothetical protein